MATDKRHVAIKNSEPQKGRSKKFDIRWTEAEQDLIKQASALKKSTATSFIRENALAAAESIVCEQQRFVLTTEQWALVDKIFSAPAKILPNLKKKLSKPEPWDEA
ncbi:MAG: hypothetical protein C0508_04880 [Cyanobacteria bacterium PR.023]|jgi:uncharacterized protein (DUF1778 family)|nr:hypothetical protein [Cyanobacteria bacterium PR.023]MDQ5934597.1 hypothetical protein [Cyanobacteriota bacterium erpe_2018_sw_21hr_WHONDRS-SW48-000092_B_bin.40]